MKTYHPKLTNELSFSQKKSYFLQKIRPESVCYNQPVTINISHKLNVSFFKQALDILIERHEILRTTYEENEQDIIAVIHPHNGIKLEYIDLSHLPRSLAAIQSNRLATSLSKTPFDLKHNLPFRFLLNKLDEKNYQFYVVIHHIAGDGESIFKVFLPELENEYFKLLGEPGREKKKPYTHLQYVEELKTQYLKTDKTEVISFWKKYLANIIPVKLPFELPKQINTNINKKGCQRIFSFGPTITKGLSNLGKRNKTTSFITFASLITVLIYKYTKTEDISIGTFCSTRSKEEHFSLIEDMTNTLVFRTILSDSMSFNEVLHSVNNNRTDIMSYSYLPFQDIIAAVNPDRKFGETPLFNIAIVIQPEIVPSQHGWVPSFFEIDVGDAKFDLLFDIHLSKNNVIARIEYRCNKYSAESIEQMIGNIKTLAQEVMTNPNKSISNLCIVSKEEALELIKLGNALTQFSKQETLIQMLEEQVESNPGNIALSFENIKITYIQLQHKTNQIARWIKNKLGNNQKTSNHTAKRIGLVFNPSIEMLYSIIAVLKLGMSYVPLDPQFPSNRLNYIIEDSQVALILTQNACKSTIDYLNHVDNKIVYLDELDEEFSSLSNSNLSFPIHPESEAYIIYTSGTTGAPKGVMINHHNVVRLFKSTKHQFNFNKSDQWTLFHSFAFDFSIWEIWGALIYGGTLHIISNDNKMDLTRFHKYIFDHNITVICQTNSAFEQLVDIDSISKEPLSALKTIIFGGESLKYEIIKRWWQKNDSQTPKIINMYGITETTVHTTYGEIKRSDPKIHIGRPLSDISVYLLDENQVPVPIGVSGEIYISGDCVSKGYLNLPEKTKERFLKNPFKNIGGNSFMYRSGDYGKWQFDGTLDYLGRIDKQVKIRGYRIELEEIEGKILEHNYVKQAIVVVDECNSNKHLIAYYVTEKGKSLTPPQLHIYLSKYLPKFMIPAYFISLDKIPFTVQGKLDIAHLPSPTEESVVSKAQNIKPITYDEKQMSYIWAKVLGLDVNFISIKDNFFDLGGTSLLSIRLIKELYDNGLELTIQDLFNYPTIEEIVELAKPIQMNNNRYIQSIGAKKISTLFPIDLKGNNPYLFLMHPSSGFAWEYKSLAGKIENQPIYGLNNPNFGQIRNNITLKEVVEKYISEIKKISPQGPYRLGGWSSGGIFAYEIAQQLNKSGYIVEIVIMFDTPYPLALTPEESTAEKINKILSIHNITKDMDDYLDFFNEVKQNKKLIENYIPCPYEGKITLIKAGIHEKELEDKPHSSYLYNWPQLIVPNLSQYVVESSHMKMFEYQFVELLIPILNKELSSLDSFNFVSKVVSEKKRL